MIILNCIPEARGWSPIQYMIQLASELFDAPVLEADGYPSPLTKALSFLPKASGRRTQREPCLMVCTGAADLPKLLSVPHWRKRFGPTAAWIIDSFWTGHIPRTSRLTNMFDRLFVTSIEDLPEWNQVSGVPTTWLPWATDALRLGSYDSQRNWDITRVGRQPPEWEDDQLASAAAAGLRIKYRPRPASDGLNSLQNQRLMMSVYADTKYVLAFSNTANPEPYTHPTRQYLTGRWVDGLAAGAIIAGVPPRGESVDPLLWAGATLDFNSVRLNEGLRSLESALPQWTKQIAFNNYLMALKNLDWRWRFKVLADSLGVRSALLDSELALLQARISGLSDGPIVDAASAKTAAPPSRS